MPIQSTGILPRVRRPWSIARLAASDARRNLRVDALEHSAGFRGVRSTDTNLPVLRQKAVDSPGTY
jgi:hypothetical protein